MTPAGSLRKIMGGIRGLTTLVDPSTNYVAYTDYRNSLNILNIKTNAVVETTLSTIAEKCVWGTTSKTTLYCAIPTLLELDHIQTIGIRELLASVIHSIRLMW